MELQDFSPSFKGLGAHLILPTYVEGAEESEKLNYKSACIVNSYPSTFSPVPFPP